MEGPAPAAQNPGAPPELSSDDSMRIAAAKDNPIVKDDGATQKQRMLAGRLYWSIKDPELVKEHTHCGKLIAHFNATKGDPGTIVQDLTSSQRTAI